MTPGEVRVLVALATWALETKWTVWRTTHGGELRVIGRRRSLHLTAAVWRH